MEGMADAAYDVGSVALAGGIENFDLNFLPKNLMTQCQSLIVSYHELHGYACLPNVLWKARLGHFIEAHQEFRQLLKKASTTRSAKKSNEGFVVIATTILSLEILASSFAGWSAIYPQAGLIARAILQHNARSPHMPLMEFYLYPPKYISSAAIASFLAERNYVWLQSRLYLGGLVILYALVGTLSLLAWFSNRSRKLLLWMAVFAYTPLALQLLSGFRVPVDYLFSSGKKSGTSGVLDARQRSRRISNMRSGSCW